AVCGIPTTTTMRLIQRLERVDRGRYTGPVGWIGANGDGDWGIALRCAQIEGRDLRVSAGAGIVAGSRPADELAETEVKLGAVLDALAGSVAEPVSVAGPSSPLRPVGGAR